MRHLFEHWSAVAKRLKAVRSIALFLDFDGTLAEIVDHPAQAALPASTRLGLERLRRRRDVRICIVSGRDHASLRRAVNIRGVRCLGLYGWDRGNGLHLDQPTRRALAAAKRDLAGRLEGLPGVWIENKGDAFAVHYRGAAGVAVRRARSALRAALEPFGEALRVIDAKKAWDVLPLAIRCKGAAVRRELAEHPADLAVYAGDDTADECAFAAVAGGISIRVGARRPSRAEFRLRDPEEVGLFLEKLEELL
jgi:trehalose-phosphatase